MATRGGPERFAEEYGLPYTRNSRAISEAEIRARLRAALRGGDVPCWPSRQWLSECASPELVAAIDRSGGPRRWADELGIPFRHLRGQRWTPDTVAAALEPLIAGRSTWPSRLQFERAGLSGLWSAIHHAEGHVAMAARYGLTLTRPDLSPAARPRPRESGP
jgi:hypothetical protein